MTIKTNLNDMTVAEYLDARAKSSGVTDETIAAILGYSSPNAVEAMRLGRAKIPVNLVSRLAEVIQVNEMDLLDRVMTEYMPDGWAVIQHITQPLRLTHNEKELVMAFRAARPSPDARAVVCSREVLAVVMM